MRGTHSAMGNINKCNNAYVTVKIKIKNDRETGTSIATGSKRRKRDVFKHPSNSHGLPPLPLIYPFPPFAGVYL